MIKNAIAYITRKRNRTLIIFIILTIVLSCLYSCLTIMKSSNEIEKALYESSNSSISITKKDGKYFNVNQFKDIEKLKEIEEKIIQYDGLAKLKDAKVVSGEQRINREDLSDEFKNVVSLEATNNTSLKIILENMKYNIGKYKERDIYINECIELVDSLTKNISQILSVHSIENLNNDEEYLKINDTLEDILKKYEILANQKKITVNNYILDENVYIGKTALKIILSNLISNAVKYTDVNGVINIGIVNDWLYIENSYGNNKISNMDKIFDVKFDLNKENSNGLGLYIVSNILNNYNIEYEALQDEEFFIFKIKIFS